MDSREIACLTIVSKNYISSARVLCESFLKYHPESSFYVVLVDKNEGYINPENEKFILLNIHDIGIPSSNIFPYQYNILELNTAVKPFALKYIFNRYGVEKLAYIDPDIMVFDRLHKVWDALDKNSIVLTPHMRKPLNDDCHPSELSIIQSGTYNLGFIGLRRGATADNLLDWWSERLYLNCVVDIPRGLFTDQKWIDLVPGYFQDTYILHRPEYNVAYWNLHERDISFSGGKFYIEGNALAFFHFSGFDPRKPHVLSKHQNRHRVDDYEDLTKVFNIYREKLLEKGFLETRNWPYGYKQLDNNVKISDPVHYVIRSCLKDHIEFPSPATHPDQFCEFLMTPNREVFGVDVAPLVTAILSYRPDVRSAFPNAEHNKKDEGFLNWLFNNGLDEFDLIGLESWRGCLVRKNSVIAISDIYHSRPDLREAFPEAFLSTEGSDSFQQWLETFGINEYDVLTGNDCKRFKLARSGVMKLINHFFGRPDLQREFRNLGDADTLDRFRRWALDSVKTLKNTSEDEIEFFIVWARHNVSVLKKINISYNCWIRESLGVMPSVFSFGKIKDFFSIIGVSLDYSQIKSWLLDDYLPSPLSHVVAYYMSDADLCRRFPDALHDKETLRKLFNYLLESTDIKRLASPEWIEEVRGDIEHYHEMRSRPNIVGYFAAATGMGESARSMLRTLEVGYDSISTYTLPSEFIVEASIDLPKDGLVFGTPNLLADQTIVVANADSAPLVTRLFPLKYCAGTKIGYWVWETESLPLKWRDNARYYDEIWSASSYSANAISNTIGLHVKVVPHVPDIKALSSVKPNREKFSLPANGFIFGYFFDQKSFLERKNPEAVIDAFDEAFRNESNVYLLMKVNSPRVGDFLYEKIKTRSSSQNIIWIEQNLSREDTFTLMASLDAYISLHRSEGFGLTMAEAMILNKPVIASAYSGNLEFMSEENSYLVEVERTEIGKNIGPYEKSCYWANPSIKSASFLMRQVYEDSTKEFRENFSGKISGLSKLNADFVFSKCFV